ncbi:hypothetical protein [Streptomyces longispororuber]|uniref:hypothetical protein n=1 Tax=Streptomyces longispororuber TaxID=68230 RepID=UPI00210CFFAA|nr:hypothetical protein [Streptomyces longispororuber]MCQ4211553.1 hypothetical protein [Streptomyces longispororuber]
MRMVTLRYVVPVLVGVLGMGAVSCGAGDDSENGGGRGLTAALSAVPPSAAGQVVTYTDVTAARRLVGTGRKVYRSLNGYGIIELTGRPYTAVRMRPSYGFDEKDVATSLLLSNGYGQRLTGDFDVAAVRAAMTKRGYRATDDDGAVRLRKKGQADVDVSGSARTTKLTDDAVPLPLDPPDRSLTDDAAYRKAVDCLGDDVYRASLYGKRAAYRKQGVTLLGIGSRAKTAAAPTETLCVVTPSEAAAEKVAGKLRGKTAAGERFAGSKVTVGDGGTPVVSMTWKNSTKSGMRPGDQDRTGELARLLLWP